MADVPRGFLCLKGNIIQGWGKWMLLKLLHNVPLCILFNATATSLHTVTQMQVHPLAVISPPFLSLLKMHKFHTGQEQAVLSWGTLTVHFRDSVTSLHFDLQTGSFLLNCFLFLFNLNQIQTNVQMQHVLLPLSPVYADTMKNAFPCKAGNLQVFGHWHSAVTLGIW